MGGACKVIAATAAALSSLLLWSCNFATQSYNLGKLLLPGENMTTLSAGKRSWHEIEDNFKYQYDSVYNCPIPILVSTDTIRSFEWSVALDYRLGVLSEYPFGKGLEIGFLIEIPTLLEQSGGPPLLQFDGRLGLPILSFRRSLYHHNAGLGWIIGAWVDNGWFAEYAGGLECGAFTPYCNFRVTRTPTDFDYANDVAQNDDYLTHHKRGWNYRACAGLSMKLRRLPVLPDYIVPEIAAYYPNVIFRKPGFAFHIGARWLNGF